MSAQQVRGVHVSDLFAQAIVQSGSPLAFWAVHNDSADLEDYARLLARQLSCDRPLVNDLVACLRTIPWNTLMAAVCAVRSFISAERLMFQRSTF